MRRRSPPVSAPWCGKTGRAWNGGGRGRDGGSRSKPVPRLTNDELIARLHGVPADLEAELAALTAPPSRKDEAALERWLQLAIQMCIDLGDRVLAANNIEEPPRQR